MWWWWSIWVWQVYNNNNLTKYFLCCYSLWCCLHHTHTHTHTHWMDAHILGIAHTYPIICGLKQNVKDNRLILLSEMCMREHGFLFQTFGWDYCNNINETTTTTTTNNNNDNNNNYNNDNIFEGYWLYYVLFMAPDFSGNFILKKTENGIILDLTLKDFILQRRYWKPLRNIL